MTQKKPIINDYRYQREVIEGTNHDRMLRRRVEREKNKKRLNTNMFNSASDILYTL
jgi:hypothetical protein